MDVVIIAFAYLPTDALNCSCDKGLCRESLFDSVCVLSFVVRTMERPFMISPMSSTTHLFGRILGSVLDQEIQNR